VSAELSIVFSSQCSSNCSPGSETGSRLRSSENSAKMR